MHFGDRLGESYLGLDIGGAHIKCADLTGRTNSTFFPLWQRPTDLAARLAELLASFPRAQHVAVTMTGELADCFSDAAQGVRHIVGHTDQAVRTQLLAARSAKFYTVDARFVSSRQATRHPDPLAASNWHALATLAASTIDRPTLLIDIGSTTTDLTALEPGKLRTRSRTDFDRLQTGELLYLGIQRTPLCAWVDTLPVDGKNVPVMNEVFATSDDCALLVGLMGESAHDCQTADGRPRTIAAARGRMAKMVGLDHRDFSIERGRLAAEYCLDLMTDTIVRAANAVAPDAEQWVLGGHGASLLEWWRKRQEISDSSTNPKRPAATRALTDLLLPLCHREGSDRLFADVLASDRLALPAVVAKPQSAWNGEGEISRVAPAFAAAYLLARKSCIA